MTLQTDEDKNYAIILVGKMKSRSMRLVKRTYRQAESAYSEFYSLIEGASAGQMLSLCAMSRAETSRYDFSFVFIQQQHAASTYPSG